MEVKASTTRLLMQLILKSLVQSSEFRGVREEDIGLRFRGVNMRCDVDKYPD